LAILGIGAAIAGGGFFAAAIDFGVSIAASIGLSYAARALAGNQQTESHFSTQGQMQASGTSPRTFILGLAATAGLLVYANTWGTSDDGKSPNAYFTQVIKVSDIPVKGLNRVWLADELCTIDTGTVTDKGSPLLEYRKDGKDHVWVKFYDGTQTTGDTFLATKVRSDDRPYEANRVGVGCAYVIATALVEDTLFTGLPQFKFEIDGIRLYDPTKDSTNGGAGTQRFTDPATWGGDGDYLTAVQAYNVLRGIRYNGAWMFGPQKTVQANLPTVNWNAQIAKCRATITRASGDEPTYRSAGQITVDAPSADALDALMTACHGKISEVGGFYKVHLGEPDSPSFSFTDDDILSTEDQDFDPFLQLADSINGITGSYPDPDQAWNPASAPAIYNAGYEAIDGSRRLLANPSFDLVPYGGQVQQLMLSALNAARRERSHRLVMPPAFWLVEPGDVGTWTSARNGYDNKSFEATAVSDKDNLDIGLSLQECDPSDYDWDHTTDYTPVPIGPTGMVRPVAQGVVDWSVTGAIIYDADGLPRRPAILLSWDADIPGITGIRWKVRLKADGSLVTADYFNQPTVSQINITQSLLPQEEYEVSVQYIPTAPRDMTWSEWRSVTTPDIRFSADDLNTVINNKITTAMADITKVLVDTRDFLDNITADSAAQNWIDKDSTQSQIVVQNDNLRASIDIVQTVALGVGQALADYKVVVQAQFDSTNAAVTSEQVARVNADAAMAADITTLNSNLGTTNANLTAEAGTRASADSALSTSLTTLSTTVGGHTSSISTISSSVNGISVQYGVVGTIDGVTGAFIFSGVKKLDGTVSYNVAINGGLIVSGTILATALNVSNLSAITANMGTLTTGTIIISD
jgi:hypothetical protein